VLGTRALQLLLFNEEYLVSVSHQLALITSRPLYTARRYYRLNGLVRSPDWLWEPATDPIAEKLIKLGHLEEVKS